MRILTVIAEMGSGGAESIVDQLVRDGLAQGEDVGLACDEGWRRAGLQAAGATVVPLPLRVAGIAGVARSAAVLRRHLRAAPVDVIHAHNVRASVAARLATQRLADRPPLVTSVHGLAAHRYAPAARVLRTTSDVVVAVSEDVATRLEEGGLPRGRIRVIENAAAPIRSLDPTRARSDLGLDPALPVVLCLARLSPPKRHDLLLEAWARCRAAGTLVIAGGGPLRDDLERQARAAGLGERVRFLGDRQDVDRLLSAADVLVLASDREGLPVTVLEAMSVGLPVVVSAVGGLLSLDPGSLRLVAPSDAVALGAALEDILGDPGTARAMGERGRALVDTRFSTSLMVRRYRSVYAEVTSTTRA